MTIRKATDREIQQIINCPIDVFEEASIGMINTKEQSVMMREQFLMSDGYYLVFVKEEQVHGWIGICESFDLYSNEVVGYLSEWYVYPQFRGEGIGEQLFDEAIRTLKLAGYNKVQLNVFSRNTIRKYYEKIGFLNIAALMEMDLKNDED